MKKQITREEIKIQIKCKWIQLSKYELEILKEAADEMLHEDDRPMYPKNFKIKEA